MPDCSRTSAISSAMPTAVATNPARISSSCDRFRASRPAAAEAARTPMVEGVSIRPVWIAL